MFEIYLITNQINEKIYVGQTIYSREARWEQHLRDYRKGRNKTLYHAFKKYGAERFVLSHLAYAKTLDELDELEIFWIEKLNAAVRGVGYNQTEGGRGFRGLSDEARERHRKSHLGDKASRYRHDLVDDEVGKLYLSGKSSLEIAKMFGANKKTILRRLERAGIEMRDSKKRTATERTPRYRGEVSTEEIIRLFHDGLPYQEIANKVGMKYSSSVYHRLQKLGFSRPLKRSGGRRKSSTAGASVEVESACLADG